MRKPKIHKVSATMTHSPKFTFSARVTKVSTEPPPNPPEPPEKPPRPPFIDRNLKAGKFVLKEGAREAIVEAIKWILGFRLPHAEAAQP